MNSAFATPWLGCLGQAAPAGRRAVSAGVATLFSAVLLVFAPGANAAPLDPAPTAAPRVVASVTVGTASLTPASSAVNAPRPGSLPRQFSIEVGPGGVLVADGTQLAASELERWAQRALAGGRFSGAVVFGDETREAAIISDVVERLRRVGFAEVRRAGRAAPPELSALSRAGAPPVIAERRAPAPNASPPRSTSPAPGAAPSVERTPPPRVSLASVGLHVDGLLNREPHRTRLVRVFEREFSTFRRCHARAERHDEGASFGVDLLIPKDGGRGKVRQTRTRLASKEFRRCMQGAFEAIRFAPPPSARPEIVSYSVLFKPSTR
jgi:hypothetical protein